MDKKVAFVTYQARPEITPSDELAQRALAPLGIRAVAAPWDDANIDWQQFDAVVLRSCWDYFHHIQKFRHWIHELDRSGVTLFNSPEVVLWNGEKTYLQYLAINGAVIVPTVYAPQGSQISITDVLREQYWDRAAIKPTISGTSLHTWISSRENQDADQLQLDALLKHRGMMLQEYLPEIKTEGELSLIFFADEFSHVVRKIPRQGDFRVQNEFGGSWQSIVPHEAILEQAKKALQAVRREHLYARVDGVVRGETFLLMELELIEPELYLDANPQAAARFAQAIQNYLSR